MGQKLKIGDKNKKLTVIERIPGKSSGKSTKVRCSCECGKEVCIFHGNFKKGKHCSCERWKSEDLTGRFYGKLKIIALHKKVKRIGNKNSSGDLYECLCMMCNRTHIKAAYVIKRQGASGCKCPKDPTIASKLGRFKSYKRNAESRNLEFALTFDEFVEICERPCYYTGIEKSIKWDKKDLFGSWESNGVDRVNNKEGYTLANSVSCHREINRMKGKLSIDEFLSLIKQVNEHLKLNN